MKPLVRYKQLAQASFADLLVYSELPAHPFWSHIESKIDFSFADRLCAVLYTGRGQHPYAPSLKLKVHLVQTYYNLSDRQTEEKIIGDLFIKRFLGLSVDFFGFDHSTIALDRSRMGHAMFQACHLYILAQMLSLGLWGDRDEQWIIDTFPVHAGAAVLGSFRLIQQAAVQVLQHLKQANPKLHDLAVKTLELKALSSVLPAEPTASERLLAFSKMVAQAHALLYFFETKPAIDLFDGEQHTAARQCSETYRALLKRVLEENSRPVQPNASNDPNGPGGTGGVTGAAEPTNGDGTAETANSTQAAQRVSGEAALQHERIPRSQRPKDRICNVKHPDVRVGRKNAKTIIVGFKVQNLCTSSEVVLGTRLIPSIEHDRTAMADMVRTILSFFKQGPQAILGDTSYGHGRQRAQLMEMGIRAIAPVPATKNPTGLFDISRFTYHAELNAFSCPNGKRTIRNNHNTNLEGTQYFFGKKNCEGCPFQAECTTSKNGRTVFRSDYAEIYEEAQAFNESTEGKEAHSRRYLVERKNNELKNDCGLGAPHATDFETLSMKAVLAGIAVNLKLVVRKLIAPKLGFLRRVKPA